MADATDRASRNQAVIDAFRANGGKVPGRPDGVPLLLLTTTGARSGQRRTTPLMYLPDGDRMVIFATNGGADKHPAWYHNLAAHPTATVEVGTGTWEVRPTVATGEERNQLYARQVAVAPVYGDYEKRTQRRIPVVILERVR